MNIFRLDSVCSDARIEKLVTEQLNRKTSLWPFRDCRAAQWPAPLSVTAAFHSERPSFWLASNHRSLNRLLCGLLRPFHRTVKHSETLCDRAAWNLQMRLKSAPESVTRCKLWLKLGTRKTGRFIVTVCNNLAYHAQGKVSLGIWKTVPKQQLKPL